MRDDPGTYRSASARLTWVLATDLFGTTAIVITATATGEPQLLALAIVAAAGLGAAVFGVAMANATLIRDQPSHTVLDAALVAFCAGFAVNTVGCTLVMGLTPLGGATLLLVGDALSVCYLWALRPARLRARAHAPRVANSRSARATSRTESFRARDAES